MTERLKVWMVECRNSDHDIDQVHIHRTEEGAERRAAKYIFDEELTPYDENDPDQNDPDEAPRREAYKRFKDFYAQEKYVELLADFEAFCLEHHHDYWWYHSAEVVELEVED